MPIVHPTYLNDIINLEFCYQLDIFSAFQHRKRKLDDIKNLTEAKTRPAWAGFKTAEEGRTKIMLIYT